MTSLQETVRPTKRCLQDFEIPVPDIGVQLHEVADSLIKTSQAIPELRIAGGTERVRTLSDRVWFKVKTADRRAVVTELRGADLPEWASPEQGSWWIGAAGRRQKDSPQHDFYARLTRECTAGTTVVSGHLLPKTWDWKRLKAEQALAWRREMKVIVLGLIAMSLTSGRLAVAEFRQHRIKALVRAANGNEAYLAIIAEGVPDPHMFALLLDCVPGITVDDWQAEPSPLADMKPESGEIIWSTLLPSDVANRILELSEEKL